MEGLLTLHFWSFQPCFITVFSAEPSYGDGNHFHDNWATPSSEKGHEKRRIELRINFGETRLLVLYEF